MKSSLKLFLLFLLFQKSVYSQSTLDKLIETWKMDPDLINGTHAFCVLNASNGQVLKEFNSNTFVIPASTLKIVTTAAALEILGKNYKFETKLYFTGNFDKTTGILNGDLIIKGSGDPTLNSEYFSSKNDSSVITDKWAKILQEKGLKEITGKIIGDASFFQQHVPAQWIWGDISNYFGVAPCGLSFNDNLYSIVYNSGTAGSICEIVDIEPNYTSVRLEHISNVKAAGKEDEAYVTGDPFGFKKNINGTIPPNRKHLEVKAALPDPALLCAEFLQKSLKKLNINSPPNGAMSNYDSENESLSKEKKLIYTHYSPSLEKIIYLTNLHSNNLYCETLVNTLGKGSSYNGLNKIKEHWKEKGLKIEELFMVDGNGLSRANTITTSFESQVLYKMYHDSALFSSFYNSLPIAGVNGSMRSLGKGTFIEKNMHAKTGYINRARGYAGYVKTKDGKVICFSVLFNNYTCSAKEMKIKIEQFLIAIAEL